MKKLYFLFLMMLIAIGQTKAQNATANLPYYEGFSYDTGSRLLNDGQRFGLGIWNIPTFISPNASPDPYIIDSPSWTLPAGLPAATGQALEFTGSGEDPTITIPDQGTSGVIYSSFVFRVTEQAGTTVGSAGYFYSFAKTASSGTSFNYTSNVYINKVDDNNFKLAIRENNNTTGIVYSGNFAINTDIFVVIKYDIDNATSYMWLNPTIGPSEPTPHFDTAYDTSTAQRTNLNRIRINLDANANVPTIQLDEIRIANTWTEVVSTTLATAGIGKDEIAGFSLYPNPVKGGKVFINSANSYAERFITVFDVLGKQVVSQKGTQNNVDVRHLNKGIYIMKVEEEGKVATRKLVIE